MNPRIHAFNSGKCRVQGIKHCFLDFGPGLEGRVSLGHECSITNHNSEIWSYNNEDMNQELSTMMDMVREMYEDGRKSNMLRKQLNSMKEEKQLLADKLQEMERQLHIANMNLKRMHESET